MTLFEIDGTDILVEVDQRKDVDPVPPPCEQGADAPCHQIVISAALALQWCSGIVGILIHELTSSAPVEHDLLVRVACKPILWLAGCQRWCVVE